MKQIMLFILAICCIAPMPAFSRNTTADAVRRCTNVFTISPTNKILRCNRDDVADIASTGIRQFFRFSAIDGDENNYHDRYVTDADYIYVNVVSGMDEPKYQDQICYRFISEIPTGRHGFYANEVCEYERPDSYL